MNTHLALAQGASISNMSDKRLHGPWLVAARTAWGIIVLIGLLLFVFGIPAYFAQLHAVCTFANTQACQGQITPGNAVALARLGISLDTYIAYILAITLFTSLVFITVGTIIFWRKSQEVIGLFVSLLLILFGCCGSTLELVNALALEHSDWGVLQIIFNMTFIIYPAIGGFFCIFPDGRFVPRWSWLLIGLWIITTIPFNAPLNSPIAIENMPPAFFAALLLPTWGSGLFVQIYRYWRVSGPEQRQQTKWFVFACFLVMGLITLSTVVGAFVPAFNQPDSLYQLTNSTMTTFFFLPLPLALGFAILRYRLWDIDILINRALVYGGLSAILLTIYFGLVFVGQFLLTNLLGSNDSVELVVSTLLVAALFQPLRQRVQRLVDRRFYRSKYNATLVVADFSATLRNEVDLDHLSQRLVAVVQETMQPAHLSLWICQLKQQKLGEDLPALRANQSEKQA
jgi:hypothetical protein